MNKDCPDCHGAGGWQVEISDGPYFVRVKCPRCTRMTKGDLIAALQGELMKISAECPLVIQTDSDCFFIKRIHYDLGPGKKKLGAIIFVGEDHG